MIHGLHQIANENNKSNTKRLFSTLLVLVLAWTVSFCEVEGGRQPIGGITEKTDGEGGSTDDSTDERSDSDSDNNPTLATLEGRVMAPSGIVPISLALVYLTKGEVPEIPDHVYHYECDNMQGGFYTLSESDGSFRLPSVPTGDWKIVTRKGNFRRVRHITVTGPGTMEVPEETTTLPGKASDDGLDTIPKFAVLLNSWDRSHDLLAKFGMGDLDASGSLIYGTEQFDIYNNEVKKAGYPPTTELFASQSSVDQYHMIFLPCPSDATTTAFANEQADKIRTFVSAGGKVYNSCCTALWTEAAFPEYIDFYGDDGPTRFDIGRISSLDFTTTGSIEDDDLSAWLQAVGGHNPQSVTFNNGYVKIDAVNEVADGHGLKEDNGVVKPYAWVIDRQQHPGTPLMVTYNFDYGKVFYSVYETSHTATTGLTAQEQVLIYVILEIGVCDNIPVL